MKKSTALEILRRYSNYSIVTVGRPDICEAVIEETDRPFFDSVNLVYLWPLDRKEMLCERPKLVESPSCDYFALESFADYLEKESEGEEFSPWSMKGYLGGYITAMISLLPPDLRRVLHLLSSSVIRYYIHWTPEDDAHDREALDMGRHYADMGDWSPTLIEFVPDVPGLNWDCGASAAFLRDGVNEGFHISLDCSEGADDEIDVVAEMGKMLSDAASQTLGVDKRDEIFLPEEVRHEDLF
jgi:hypothetical protein